MAARIPISQFELANPLYKNASISFYTVANGVKTAILATLYSGASGVAQLSNPQKLNSQGQFKQPVYIQDEVIGTVTGISVASHDTGIISPAPIFRVTNNPDPVLEYSYDDGVTWNSAGAVTSNGAASLITFVQSGAGASTRWLQDKVREMVNVDDFGAAGDGATDDGPAIALAIASIASAGGTIAFTRGKSYLVNTRVEIPYDNITLDFGTATILNTVAPASFVSSAQTVNPLFYFSANQCKAIGGHFVGILCQLFAFLGTAATHLNGAQILGTKITTLDNSVANGNAYGAQIRYVDNVIVRDMVMTDVGAAVAASAGFHIFCAYCNSVTIRDNIMTDGACKAVGFLEVYGGFITGNLATGIYNSLSSGTGGGYIFNQSSQIKIDGNIFSGIGGSGIKLSDLSYSCSCSNNVINLLTSPAGQTDNYAGIFASGTEEFVISNNVVTADGVPCISVSANTRNTSQGIISGNVCEMTTQAGYAAVEGGGIKVIQSTPAPGLFPIVVSGNYCYNGQIRMQTNAQDCVVNGNTVVTTDDYGTTENAAIVLYAAAAINVFGNIIKNLSADPTNAGVMRYGIAIIGSCGYSNILGNSIEWPASSTFSTSTYDDGNALTVKVRNNISMNASVSRHVGVAGRGTVTQQTDKTTGVTLNALSGTVTMNAANLVAGTVVFFKVTNSLVKAGDVVAVSDFLAGIGAYQTWTSTVTDGSFYIGVKNITAGDRAEALTINFAVIPAGSI